MTCQVKEYGMDLKDVEYFDTLLMKQRIELYMMDYCKEASCLKDALQESLRALDSRAMDVHAEVKVPTRLLEV